MKFNWFRRQQREAELDAEIRSHLDEAIRDRIARGETPDEARAHALREFGNAGLVKEVTREMWGWAWLERLLQDLRFGLRMLRKNPGFSLIAILTLGLGIGANTAVFSVINAALFQPLPVKDASRLVRIYTSNQDESHTPSSYLDYADYRERNQVFSEIAAHAQVRASLGEQGEHEIVWGEIVSGNYFAVLGINAVQGRVLLPEDDRPAEAPPVVVISHDLWQRRFGADPALVGKTVRLNGHPLTVAGIAPAGFRGAVTGFAPEFWVPLALQRQVILPGIDALNRRQSRWLFLLGRLRADSALPQAEAQMKALASQLEQAYPDSNRGCSVRLIPADQVRVFPQIDQALVAASSVLLAMVGLVLLIVCANVANLLLARMITRRREIAIRLALGASRGRLVRQLLAESAWLALLGGSGGLALALWLVDLLMRFKFPLPVSVALHPQLDRRVLGFTLAVSLLTGLLAGLWPALQASKPDLAGTLKDETLSSGMSRMKLRNALVVAQVALSLALLICTGLFVRSWRQAHAINPGFNSDEVLTLSFDPNLRGYEGARARELCQQILTRAAALPGVQSASLAASIPLTLHLRMEGIVVEGHPLPTGRDGILVDANAVAPGYFQTLGIALVRGRDFSLQDRAETPKSVIINETMGRRFWPNEDPLGKRLSHNGPQGPFLEVIGVARDSKYRTLGEAPLPFIYLPLLREYEPEDALMGLTLLVRARSEPQSLAAAVRREIESLDAELPVFNIQPLTERIGIALALPRLAALLFGAFGAVGLLLVSAGIYGVISYAVGQRTREFGIRAALGATDGDVMKLVVRQGLKLAMLGIVLGLVISFAVTRLLSSLLYGVSATDPLTFALITLLLIAVSLVACWIPARRATKVDPLIALRSE